MKSALEYLGGLSSNKKIAILGDMLELGEYSEKLHRDVGICVAENNIDMLITVGENAKYIADETILKGISKDNVYVCADNKEAIDKISKIDIADCAILVKASRGMRLEEISSYIKNNM